MQLQASKLCLAAAMILSMWSISACLARVESKPDIILISLDTLRVDRLGCYGEHEGLTPNIDRLARESRRFENALAHASDTRLSFSSILSGYYPHETRTLETRVLQDQITTLPEILRDEGYSTMAVVSNYVLRAGEGFEQGFDIYDDTMDEAEAVRGWPERTGTRTTSRAIELLQSHEDSEGLPLFLWVHYQDPHGPYTPPPSYLEGLDAEPEGQALKMNATVSGYGGIPSYQALEQVSGYESYVARYEAEIRYLDACLGELFKELDRLGYWDTGVVVLTADHGEALGEGGYYFCHGETLHGSQTRVPLVIRDPDHRPGVSSEYVQHVDLVPTLLETAGVAVPSTMRGSSVWGERDEPEIFAALKSKVAPDQEVYSLVKGEFKLLHFPLTKRYELYDLRTDPIELNDLVHDTTYRARLRELREDMLRILGEDRVVLDEVPAARELSQEERERLRALGYSQ